MATSVSRTMDELGNSSSRQSSKKMKRSKSSITVMGRPGSFNQSSVSKYQGVVNKNSSAVVSKNSSIVSKEEYPKEPCNCGPDFFSRVLGPTADEIILTGLQALVELCSKLKTCPDKQPCEEESEREASQIYDTIPEKENEKDNSDAHSQTEEKPMTSKSLQVAPKAKSGVTQTAPGPGMMSESVQANTRNLLAELKERLSQRNVAGPSWENNSIQTSNPTVLSHIMQTSNPDLQSDFVQTSNLYFVQSGASQTISTPPPSYESQISQTQNLPSISERVQTIEVPKLSLVPELTQTISEPQKPKLSLVTRQSQTLSEPKKSKPSLATQQSQTLSQPKKSKPSLATQQSQTLSVPKPSLVSERSQTIAEPKPSLMSERSQTISETKSLVTQSSQVDSIETLSKEIMASDPGEIKESIDSIVQTDPTVEHKCICPPEPPRKSKSCKCCKCSSTCVKKQGSVVKCKIPCICGNRKSKCRCCASKTLKRSSLTIGSDRSQPLNVRYAVSRITIYKEYTIYEIMKSTKNEPKQIPKVTEGVFVLKKKKE